MYRANRPYSFRGRSIYSNRRRHRSRILVVSVWVVLSALAVFLGWSITPVIQNLASGKYSRSAVSSKTKITSGTSGKTSSKASSGSSGISSAGKGTAVKGIFLPSSDLSDTASLEKAASAAKSAGFNLAVIELKGENGVIAYSSKISEVQQGSGMVAPGAPDASAAVKVLEKYGLTPAAKISCFKDPVAPVSMREASILYSLNHTMRWLDTSRNRWLNPYSAQAQQYIIDLAKEAVSLGFKQIYLDNVEFPSSDVKAWYGDNLSSKEDALKSFVASAAQQVSAAGGKVSVVYPGIAALGQAAAATGQDQSIYGFSADYFSPNLCPSLLGNPVTIGASAVSNPDQTPAGTVSAEAAYLKTQAGGSLDKTVPFIQAYTNTSPGGKQYTADDINGEISALKGAGIQNYILYSPDGSYDLSGVAK